MPTGSVTSKLAAAAQAIDLQRRRSARLRKARQLRWRHRLKRLVRAVTATGLILFAALFIGLFRDGLGADGLLLTLLLMAVTFVVLAIFPRTASLAKGGGETDLAALADRTQHWLESQRSLVPPRARPVIDLLGNQLDELAPRLPMLSETHPAGRELHKLLAEHLPSLVHSYTSIPAALADQPHAGSTPAAQLQAGLETVTREVATIGKSIAADEMDALAIRHRYLDTRYDPAARD